MSSENKIIAFMPEGAFTARQNVEKFVRLCRDELTIFGSDLDWESDMWDLTKHLALRGKSHAIRASWSNHDTSKHDKKAPQMQQPFLDFAKAYFRYQHGFHPTKAFGPRLAALRALERALCLGSVSGSCPNIEDADGAVFNLAAQFVVDKVCQRVAYRTGQHLELVADFIVGKRLTRVSFQWKNPIRRPADKNRIGKEADVERAKNLPTEEALAALASAYNTALEPRDILITSAAAILCAAPSRIGELLTFPADCEHESEGTPAKGKRYALRWWPENGAEPMLKWIVASIEDVARDAVMRLRKVTEPGRQIAKWYEEHPGEVYLPEDYCHLRHRHEIRLDDVTALLGLKNRDSVSYWLKTKQITSCGRGSEAYCSFADFEKAVLADLPATFPILDEQTELRFSEAMFVVPDGFFSGRFSQVMITSVDQGHIRDGLGNRQQHGVDSVFSRLRITAADDTPIVIRSHQFRHLLNTMAQRGGAAQFDIAKWSGRKREADNDAYNHMTSDEFLANVRTTGGGNILGPIGELIILTPIPRAEFLSMKMPTAHITELGFCVTDWSMNPCELHLDCINCRSHACVKGDREKTDRINATLRQSKELLAEAESAHNDERGGADRWVIHQRTTVERLNQLVKILDDPSVPIGAIITLSIRGEYSAIGNAVDDRIRLGGSDAKWLGMSRQSRELPKLS